MNSAEAIAVLREALGEAVRVIERIKPPEFGNVTIVIGRHALAATEHVEDGELDQLRRERDDARHALRDLTQWAENQICTHESTHRGGAIWEICDQCGAKWADDEGGKPGFKWPAEIEVARVLLAGSPAAAGAGDRSGGEGAGRKVGLGWNDALEAAAKLCEQDGALYTGLDMARPIRKLKNDFWNHGVSDDLLGEFLEFLAAGEFYYAGEGEADDWAARSGIHLDSLAQAFGYHCVDEAFYELEHGTKEGWWAKINGWDEIDTNAAPTVREGSAASNPPASQEGRK
jgi:hypothetical protein